jgi:glutathione synthase/RimK-type ligase-like ATP-grasp enzyme
VSKVLGLHKDHIRHANGEEQSFSARWRELALAKGFDVKALDARSRSFFQDVASCDAFMWRFGYSPLELQLGKRVVETIEQALKIPVYPSSHTAWHFEDKISQQYLLASAGLPIPTGNVFWSRKEALKYAECASYPFVAKLATGMRSRNVVLVRTEREAKNLIDRLFGPGMDSIRPSSSRLGRLAGRKRLALKLLLGRPLPRSHQMGYFFAQEFLPGNTHDTRVTVIGNRAFAFRRFNRPGDFRASGSGRIDWDPTKIDVRTVKMAFDVAARLGTQSTAIDFLSKDGAPVILEISYTFGSWAVRDCPGHWLGPSSPEQPSLEWVVGSMRPEDAIFEDFTNGW